LIEYRYAFSWQKMSATDKNKLAVRSHDSLTTFHKSIDDRMILRRGHTPPSVLYFQIAYQTALLLIHRPFLNEPVGSSTHRLALRTVTTAAANISRHVRAMLKEHTFEAAPPHLVTHLLSAAVIHALNATAGNSTLARQSANGLKPCMDALQELGRRWNAQSQRAICRIQELARRWDVVWALPIRFSNAPLGSDNTQMAEAATMAYTDFNMENSASDFDSVALSDLMGAGLWDDEIALQGAFEQVDVLGELPGGDSLEWLFKD
jgi:hypothetical protein